MRSDERLVDVNSGSVSADIRLEMLHVWVVVTTVHQSECVQVVQVVDGAEIAVDESCRFVEEQSAEFRQAGQGAGTGYITDVPQAMCSQ